MSISSTLYDPEKIRSAYEDGIITEEEKIRFYIKTLTPPSLSDSPPTTDERYSTTAPIKCATEAALSLHLYTRKRSAHPSLTQDAKRALREAIPTLDQTYTSPSGYFHIHYTKEGTHAVPLISKNKNGIPDYIQSAAFFFEHTKSVTCGERGFQEPLGHLKDHGYHVYVYNLENKYGVTFSKSILEMTAKKQRRATSVIALDNNYSSQKGFSDSWENCMKVSVAHEFFHAIQYSYNIDADFWWKEASATWNEDEIYDAVNDYLRYIHLVYDNPENPLQKSSYGGVVFAKYLCEYHGGYNIMKKIWESQGTLYDTSTKAIDHVLSRKSPATNLTTAFKEYTAFNYNPKQYYRDGALFRTSVATKKSYQSFPLEAQDEKLRQLSCRYILLDGNTLSENQQLLIEIHATEKAKQSTKTRNPSYAFQLQCRQKADGLCTLSEIKIDPAQGSYQTTIDGFGSHYSEACLIPVNCDVKKERSAYTFVAKLV